MRADDGREKIRMQQKVIARTNNREKTTKKTRERQLKDESENLLKFFYAVCIRLCEVLLIVVCMACDFTTGSVSELLRNRNVCFYLYFEKVFVGMLARLQIT